MTKVFLTLVVLTSIVQQNLAKEKDKDKNKKHLSNKVFLYNILFQQFI